MNSSSMGAREPHTWYVERQRRANLINKLAENGEEDENTKELILETTLGIVNVEERQANKQGLR